MQNKILLPKYQWNPLIQNSTKYSSNQIKYLYHTLLFYILHDITKLYIFKFYIIYKKNRLNRTPKSQVMTKIVRLLFMLCFHVPSLKLLFKSSIIINIYIFISGYYTSLDEYWSSLNDSYSTLITVLRVLTRLITYTPRRHT